MITRQGNWLGQQRVDVPHIRAMESSVAADFDVLAGRMMSGKQPLVLKGMNVITNGALGAQASALQVQVADAMIMHFGASESGTIFWVPDTQAAEVLSATNPKVSGSFTASQTNYVGLDLRREADDSTSDNVQFLEGTTLREVAKTVPLARTLGLRFVISTSDFSSQPNVLPVAKVVTDANNNVVSVEDARQMLFRLGSGGDFPDRQFSHPWSGTRYENTSGNVFAGGDKAIGDLKTWMNAVMTRLWEVGGGEYWYSATADRNVTLIWTGATFSNGENFEWDGTHLHWQGLKFVFDNSTGHFNNIADQTTDSAGLTDLADGECLYVDLDRTQDLSGASALVAVKAPLTTLGPGSTPGARQIVAWRVGASIYTRNWRYAVGTTFTPATSTSTGVVQLNHAPVSASNPEVVVTDASERAVAQGLTRGGFASGAVDIGTGANDASVMLSKAGALTTIGGSLAVTEGIDGDLELTNGNLGVFGNIAGGGTLTISGIAYLPEIDNALLGGGVTIGGTSANAVSIGRAGITTTIAGTADIQTIDRAGAISIGQTAATSVSIGRAGFSTIINSVLLVDGAISSGGNVSVPSVSEFLYETPKTGYAHVLASEIAVNDASHIFVTSTGSAEFRSAELPATARAGACRVKLPAGATITSVEVYCRNADGVDRDLTVTVSLNTYHATSGYTGSTISSGAVTPNPPSTGAWRTVPLNAGPHVVPSDGAVLIGISLTSSTTASFVGLTSIRVTYTQTNLRPNT